jgi:hypothetical protein
MNGLLSLAALIPAIAVGLPKIMSEHAVVALLNVRQDGVDLVCLEPR